MITPDSTFEIRRIPLCELMVTEYQPRYFERVAHYVRLLQEHPDAAPGFLCVQPRGDRYELLDGHHRYVAHIITGRPEALCIIITEPERAPTL